MENFLKWKIFYDQTIQRFLLKLSLIKIFVIYNNIFLRL